MNTKDDKQGTPDLAETQLSNVASIVDFAAIKNRIEMLSTVFPKDLLLEALGVILQGIGSLTELEYTSIAILIRDKMKEVGTAPTPRKIEQALREFLSRDDRWKDRTFVGQENGYIYILASKKSNEKFVVSNFTLTPTYTVTVQGEGGKKYHMYDVHVMGDPKTYRIKLAAADFHKLDTLQAAVSSQLAHTSANISGCATNMKDLTHKFITLGDFEHNQLGTSLLGLERFENDGPKYFCSPTGIYSLDGKTSSEIVFMGNEESNQDELRNLTNLEYQEEKWRQEIAPVFLSNIVHINDRDAMMSILGWMGAIPHDYVVRKEVGTGFFPHCHLIGEPGSGKSTVMTLFKQFMGHNDGSPRTFPTPFETSKLLNSSYTIPVVLDEYGKRWNPNQTDAMNKILVESFTKARWSRGQSNLGSVYFKYKNPLLMGGQIPTSDQALATRIVPVTIYKSFQNTKAGKQSFVHLTKLQKMQDKNFWVGFNLWCAQHSNEEVASIYEAYRQHCRNIIDENRVADIYAIVMLGLHFMKKLALELGISEDVLGFNDDSILGMAKKLDSAADSTDSKETPLTQFLQSLAQYALSVGNSETHGKYFGKGLAVMEQTVSNTGAGQYGGKNSKSDACIYGKELLLVKVSEVVEFLNKRKKKDLINEKEVMTFINAEFRKSMQDPMSADNLVLAPKQFRNKFADSYTAFHKSVLYDSYGEFRLVVWKN